MMTISEKLVELDEGVEKVASLNAELEQTLYGTDTGGKSYYDEFWNQIKDILSNNDGGAYLFAGRAWTANTFRPPFDLILKGDCRYCFYNNASQVDFPELLAELGTRLNTTAVTYGSNMFNASRFTRIGELDLSNCGNANYLFNNNSYLHTITKLIVNENLTLNTAFNGNFKLTSLTIEGIIGQNGFDVKWSPLDKESLISIVTHLSETTSGLTVTLSLNAVKKAFETSEDANDGDTSPEWLALVATRPNWTVVLATV